MALLSFHISYEFPTDITKVFRIIGDDLKRKIITPFLDRARGRNYSQINNLRDQLRAQLNNTIENQRKISINNDKILNVSYFRRNKSKSVSTKKLLKLNAKYIRNLTQIRKLSVYELEEKECSNYDIVNKFSISINIKSPEDI